MAEPMSVLPEYLAKSRLLKRRRVKKNQLSAFTEQMMLLHAPESQRVLWQTLIQKAGEGNMEAVKILADIFKLVQKGGGMNFIQQMYSSTATGSAEGMQVKGFDSFVRSVTESRNGGALPPPEDEPKRLALTPILDAEVVDA